MEAIDGDLGVSSKCSQGLSTEEIIEILKIAGFSSQKFVAVEISDYNPFIEDWTTGRLVATMFYYFALGFSMRLS
jgi:formiminoglutamase